MTTTIAIEGSFGAVSYAELDERLGRRAKSLVTDGVRPGDRVLVRARADLPTLETMLATLRLGAVLVPIAEGATPAEVDHVVATVRPRARFDERPAPIDPVFASSTRLPDPPARTAPALVVFTSGTTGKPKGAVLSHAAIDACNRALADAWSWSADDVLSLSLPLFHVHGLCLGLLGTLALGARVLIEPRFSVDRVIEHFGRDGGRDAPAGCARATLLFSVPTMLHRLVEHAEREGSAAQTLAAGRLVVSGSAPLPLRDLERFRAATGHRVVERYGMTETLMITANRWIDVRPVASHDVTPLAPHDVRPLAPHDVRPLAPHDVRPLAPHDVRPPLPARGEGRGEGYRAGSVGRALPDVTIALADDEGRVVAPGEIGEVTLSTPSLFDGYVVAADDALAVERGDAVRDGRFATGDVGRIDDDGFLWLLGRKSTDVLKSGGFKVGAGEVEAALLDHPAVAECAVVGIPDADLGERIVAVVVARAVPGRDTPNATELMSYAADRLVAYKRPRTVLVCDALPRNAMGKIQKKLLVEELRDAPQPSENATSPAAGRR